MTNWTNAGLEFAGGKCHERRCWMLMVKESVNCTV